MSATLITQSGSLIAEGLPNPPTGQTEEIISGVTQVTISN